MTALRPFFCYYGGKWRDTPKHFPTPTHDKIIEPFAGSAGYALRYPDRDVLLYEIDPILAGIWSYLIAVTPQEILSIPDVPLDGSVDDLNLHQEAAWLVGFWLNRASAPRKTPSRWMRSGIRPGSFWGDRVRQTIAGQLDYIRHWRVVHGSYEECPDIEATWFVDPPYQYAGQHYRHGARGINYGALGAWCRSRQGQTIVCENEGADWLPFTLAGEVKTTRKVARSREAVWLSGATVRVQGAAS
jgi:hypothetical protein